MTTFEQHLDELDQVTEKWIVDHQSIRVLPYFARTTRITMGFLPDCLIRLKRLVTLRQSRLPWRTTCRKSQTYGYGATGHKTGRTPVARCAFRVRDFNSRGSVSRSKANDWNEFAVSPSQRAQRGLQLSRAALHPPSEDAGFRTGTSTKFP